jgi:hypothetical protein
MAKIYHTKSGASEEAIKLMVKKFEDGDINTITDGIKFQVPEEFPSSRYSLLNRLMIYHQGDTMITGSYKFWKDNGRFPTKGSAVYIYKPLRRKGKENESGEESYYCYGFSLIPSYPIEKTEINKKFEGDVIMPPDLTPAELPPLLDIAEKLGLKVDWKPVPFDRWADYTKAGKRINMGTDSPKVFFHELAHGLHEEVDRDFQNRTTEFKEVVAEFGSAVMMNLYLQEDSSGNAWKYIKHFADDPAEAIQTSLSMIHKMFSKLEQLQEVTND